MKPLQNDNWTTTPDGLIRARGLGLPFEGTPGPFNAITDVEGVHVGYCTLISGDGSLIQGKGPVRTGVTAILPRGHDGLEIPVFAGLSSLNGNGEMTGSHWMEEAGQCGGPITITNTHSCGIARDASIQWMAERAPEAIDLFSLPVAAETYDGYLNDINGFHITRDHVHEAIAAARSGPISEGSVGGGTGMIVYEFKGGSGTASRVVPFSTSQYTVGVFVQSNFGLRRQLTVAGVPVGKHLTEGTFKDDFLGKAPDGSIIVIVATDAPLMPHQLKRLARRAGLGIGRSGAAAHHGSGDIFMAFSTANGNVIRSEARQAETLSFLPDPSLDPLFEAVIQATDEAIINSMTANRTMTGINGLTVQAIPHDDLIAVMKQYGRLN